MQRRKFLQFLFGAAIAPAVAKAGVEAQQPDFPMPELLEQPAFLLPNSHTYILRTRIPTAAWRQINNQTFDTEWHGMPIRHVDTLPPLTDDPLNCAPLS